MSSTRKKTKQEPRAPRPKALRDQVVGRVCRIADAMVRISSWHLQKRWNLRHTDLRLLNVLDGQEPLSVNEIGRRALVDQAWVSRSLRTLEAARLVERRRDPEDSRLALIYLTPRGRKTLDEFRPYAAWSEGVLLKGIDEEQFKAMLDVLEANTQNMISMFEHMPRGWPGEK